MTAATSERMTDYYAAREAHELRLEAACGTRNTSSEEAQRFYRQTGAADLGGETPFTYKMWLEQTRRPAPSPDDHHALTFAENARPQDAHAAAEDARATYERLTAERGAIMAELISNGRTYTDVAALVGLSRARAHQLVHAHHARNAADEYAL